MTSTTNSSSTKLFHTYENVGYDAEPQLAGNNYTIPQSVTAVTNGNGNGNGPIGASGSFSSTGATLVGSTIAINKASADLPFVDPIVHNDLTPNITPNPTSVPLQTAKILSTTTDSTGVTRMLTSAASSSLVSGGCSSSSSSSSSSTSTSSVAISATSTVTASAPAAAAAAASGAAIATGANVSPIAASTTTCSSHRAPPGQNLVTKLVTFPAQSPMDSLKEWSVSTFKCTKQLINEKRGICPVTNDSHLQNDIELLRENRNKLIQMLRYGQQMTNHYSQLVRTQKQLHALMNEMSMKCFTSTSSYLAQATNLNNNSHYSGKPSGKQMVANFSSLGNNLSSTTFTSPTHRRPLPPQHQSTIGTTSSNSTTELHNFEDFLPVFNHMKSTANLNLVDDFKKNSMALNAAIKNGEKLLAALNFYCSNLSTLINKTIEDTLTTVKQYESARLEYDAEKNSLNNFISPTAQTCMTYSSEKLELARMRYEQLKEDVQIKLRLLEENTTKVMHKQLLIFNGAFASYTSGNTAALDATLRQFSIRESGGGGS